MNEPLTSFALAGPRNDAPAPVTRWELVGKNVLALVLAPCVAYFGMLMAVFASDAGPNLLSYITLYAAYAVIPVTIVCIIMSQLRRSRRWANAPLVVMFAPLALLFGLATLGSIWTAIFSIF